MLVLVRLLQNNNIVPMMYETSLLLLGIVAKLEGKMVLLSAQILEYVEVRTMLLNWRKERSHRRLGATMTLLGKMYRRN